MGEVQRGAVSGPGEEDSTTERLEALVRRAQEASEEERGLLGEDINTLLLQLPSAPEPQRGATLVRSFLDSHALAGLGTPAMPSNIAATQALLGLGYPDALTLTPEELDSLRQWQRQRFAVPWLALLVTLFGVILIQVFILTLGTDNALVIRFNATLRALSGEPPAPPTLMELHEEFVRNSAYRFLFAQFVAGAAAFFYTVTAGRRGGGRVRARRVFLTMAGVGAAMALFQLPANGWIAATTFTAAAGAFICAANLKPT
ncbi:hypothetical protein LXT21_22775 [Myxococcus sp. K38C18041901]|uniref:hypothetical protein n=1 Tax=Myxococcus guangdongensis TaxID=2906760 RepID=UPI0020A74AAF|nr:hypothetical protein [Myxococcus guangdongensis]MCP3061615.1 hypothetical protein [Myxococcus guangdongensis]